MEETDQPLKAEVVFVGGLTNHETLLMPLIQKKNWPKKSVIGFPSIGNPPSTERCCWPA